MKLLFTTLLCHRDIDTFIFNWFCCRVNLSKGFQIPHMILHDGSLTEEDFNKLRKLTNIYIEEKPVDLYKNAPKAKYLAKVKLLEIGFVKYKAERVVIIDADVFFYRPWDSDFSNILMSDCIAMMDFGSSLGPNRPQYKEVFGVDEDEHNPTCNTGIYSTTLKYYHEILLGLIKHLNDPFLIMEDQGVLFSGSYGHLTYIEHIRVLVNGAGEHKGLWDWVLSQNGAHLVSMRVREDEYNALVEQCLSLLPNRLKPGIFKPIEYHIEGGRLAFDTYSFEFPLPAYPSLCSGNFVTDAVYMSGGSFIKWRLPSQITKFECSVMLLDNGIKENAKAVDINGTKCSVGFFTMVDVRDQELMIRTESGEKTFYALTFPRFHFQLDRPTTEFGTDYPAKEFYE